MGFSRDTRNRDIPGSVREQCEQPQGKRVETAYACYSCAWRGGFGMPGVQRSHARKCDA